MGLIFKGLLVLVVVGFAGLTGFAYIGDLSPDQHDVNHPVVLNVD